MTVIAWDGKYLAADRRACNAGLARSVTKVFRVGPMLVGLSGDLDHGLEMLEWVKGGFEVAMFPSSQRDKDAWAPVVVIKPGPQVLVYERTPYPILIEDKFWATGSGRDYAVAAMHLGFTAARGVLVACEFEIGCGNGVDVLPLEE